MTGTCRSAVAKGYLEQEEQLRPPSLSIKPPISRNYGSLRRGLKSLRGSLGNIIPKSKSNLPNRTPTPQEPSDGNASTDDVPHSSPIAVPLPQFPRENASEFSDSVLREVEKIADDPCMHDCANAAEARSKEKHAEPRPLMDHRTSTTSSLCNFPEPALSPGVMFQLDGVLENPCPAAGPADVVMPTNDELVKQASTANSELVLEKALDAYNHQAVRAKSDDHHDSARLSATNRSAAGGAKSTQPADDAEPSWDRSKQKIQYDQLYMKGDDLQNTDPSYPQRTELEQLGGILVDWIDTLDRHALSLLMRVVSRASQMPLMAKRKTGQQRKTATHNSGAQSKLMCPAQRSASRPRAYAAGPQCPNQATVSDRASRTIPSREGNNAVARTVKAFQLAHTDGESGSTIYTRASTEIVEGLARSIEESMRAYWDERGDFELTENFLEKPHFWCWWESETRCGPAYENISFAVAKILAMARSADLHGIANWYRDKNLPQIDTAGNPGEERRLRSQSYVPYKQLLDSSRNRADEAELQHTRLDRTRLYSHLKHNYNETSYMPLDESVDDPNSLDCHKTVDDPLMAVQAAKEELHDCTTSEQTTGRNVEPNKAHHELHALLCARLEASDRAPHDMLTYEGDSKVEEDDPEGVSEKVWENEDQQNLQGPIAFVLRDEHAKQFDEESDGCAEAYELDSRAEHPEEST